MKDAKDAIDEWAKEVVRKIAEAERLGGGFRLYHAQAAHEIAARVRNGHNQGTQADQISITVTGPKEQALPIARAIRELLQESTNATTAMPEEAENPFDGDSIEQLGNLRLRSQVIIQTRGAE